MENCVDESINNDFLSQSYSQGIERITGTKDHIFNFQIPKQVLEVREKTWDNLFNKYSKEMSDDIELNVDTLEPEEDGNEREVSEKEYSCGRRIPMRKPAILVQYWINTGNPPYKALLNENELSETGSSLSEKEISPLYSPVSNIINQGDKREHSDSSYSSVDTAAYILSNANITKKADTIAIIEGAKCVNIKSVKDTHIKDIEVVSGDKIKCIGTARVNHMIDSNGTSNVNTNTELCAMSTEYMALKTYSQPAISITSANTVQPNVYSQNSSCEETDKIDALSTSQRSLDVQSIDDIVSIFRQFDGTLKRLTRNDRIDDTLNQDEVLDKDNSHEKRMSANIIAQEIIAEDTNVTTFHRKKLYTNRESPVDLILTKRHNISRLPGAKQSLHPALDPDYMIKKKTFLIHKGKNKRLSSFNKKNLGFEKATRKRKRKCSSIFSKNIDINNKITNNKIQDSIIDSSSKSLSDSHNNSDRRDDIPLRGCNDTNIPVRNETCEQDLTSFNLNPIVLLERITPLKRHESKSVKSNYTMQESSVYDRRHLNRSRKIHTCEIGNLELEMIDSDESTILICQCKRNESQHDSSSSDCSLNLRLSTEDDVSASNVAGKDDEISSLKDIDMSQDKEPCIVLPLELPPSANEDYTNIAVESQVLNKNDTTQQEEILNKSKAHSSNPYGTNKTDNVKLREIKIALERLPLSVNKICTNTVVEMHILSKNDTINQQKKMLNKFKTHSSNLYRRNKTDNVKLPEIRVVLERLPSNICFKRNGSVTNTNTFVDGKKILPNISLHNNKRKPRIREISKILACEDVKVLQTVQTDACNNYSLRMHAQFKKNNDRTSDTSDTVVEHGNQVSDETKSDSIFQHKNHNRINQDNHSKYSVLTFTSSDEDDFVRLIEYPKKRSKISTNDKTLGEMNTVEKNLYDETKLLSTKDKYPYNRSLSTVIHSSRKAIPRDIGSAKKKKGQSDIFSNYNKNMNNDSKKYLGTTEKRNGTDSKDDVRVIFLQTKTFDSSDSEENNSYVISTHKVLKSPSRRHRRYYNHANSEKFCNDSIAERHSSIHSTSVNSSLEKHTVVDRIHNIRTKSRLTGKETKVSEQLVNEEFNDNINSRISDIRRDMSPSSFINDIRNVSVREKTFVYTSLEKNNFNSLSENKQISDKSKNSIAIQQDNVKSTASKLLMFQTKSYYDSDSSESL